MKIEINLILVEVELYFLPEKRLETEIRSQRVRSGPAVPIFLIAVLFG